MYGQYLEEGEREGGKLLIKKMGKKNNKQTVKIISY